MPMRRENVAAALRYLQDRADLRGRLQRATSLDPQEQDLADIAVETGASFVPGVGPALAARDFERARRADDEAGMAMAAAGAIPGGKLAKLLKGFDPTRLELDVYHGTPHRFPATEANPLGEFDASKIGTGEGAQAYGHGIYYAENPEVAKGYQSSLSADRGFSFEGKTGLTRAEVQDMVNAKYGKGYLDNILRPSGVADSFIDDMVTGVTRAEGAYPKQYKPGSERAKLYDELRGKITHASPGTLYKADLPDEMIDRMLDWDKPLSEQPAAVKNLFPTLEEAKAIDAEMIRLSEATLAANDINGPAQAAWEAMYKSPQYKMAKIVIDEADPKLKKKFANGQQIYRAIGGGDDKASAEKLRAFGIPGIKYLDAGSRGQGGSGTRNFVVFPGEEKKVRILERDGQKAPPQKIAQALEAAPSKAAKAEPQPFGVQGYLNDDLRRVKQNFFSQYGVEENKQFSKDYEVVELAKLKPSENINESKIQSLMKTMREEGNARDNPIPPIIVDSEGNILDGHHRYEAAKRLGAKYVPIVELFDKRKGPVFSE